MQLTETLHQASIMLPDATVATSDFSASFPYPEENIPTSGDDPLNQTSLGGIRHLAADEGTKDDDKGEIWEMVYTSIVLFLMLAALLSDRVGADMVMLAALTMFMLAEIITLKEGLEGFANEGLLTVMVLFVVAAGISITGALDWYMAKLLGRPKSAAQALLRLMVPIAVVSAFLNNTPVVAVMIPIVKRWSKNSGVAPQQLFIPLSFACILGGTCTLIGTSTNLVVVGLLDARFPDGNGSIGLFDLGKYGVPVAIAGMAYLLVASPFLLPGEGKQKDGDQASALDGDNGILLGARLTKWSPAAGRSVKRSGLRDTGGLYLVSVYRAATGNVHRAVGQDFVLNVGDVLYFTGLVEGFGDFCQEHGLEVVTNEAEDVFVPERNDMTSDMTSVTESVSIDEVRHASRDSKHEILKRDTGEEQENDNGQSFGMGSVARVAHRLPKIDETREPPKKSLDNLTATKEALALSDEAERLRTINRMRDMIHGIKPSPLELVAAPIAPEEDGMFEDREFPNLEGREPSKIVVVIDSEKEHQLVVVGISVVDRPGLLLDISRALLRLGLQLHHTEAAVLGGRSVSIWRCEVLQNGVSDMEEIWSVLNALLENETGIEALKKRGLRVLKAVVTKNSRLVGKNSAEADFRQAYKAAIVAVQRDGKNVTEVLSKVCFQAGDVLVLQVSEDSPLLARPPVDFYKKTHDGKQKKPGMKSSVKNLVNRAMMASDHSSASGKSNENASQSANVDDGQQPECGADVENQGKGDHIASQELESNHSGEASSNDCLPVNSNTTEDENSRTSHTAENAWKDLQVFFPTSADIGDSSESKGAVREFLTAMEIIARSQHVNKTVSQAGLDRLSGVFLVSVERPLSGASEANKRSPIMVVAIPSDATPSPESADNYFSDTEAKRVPVSPDEPLKEGDILWYAGSATAVGDLRKIPGLKSFESEEVQKMNEKVHDRRLVQAVVARKGPLVGKTVRDVRFRTHYGAAVIAVHREGKRVHEHPGKVKLQAGDVLLLEAGPSFLERNADNDRSFALLSEVRDSAPPRLRLLIPALVLAIAMLAVYTAGVASLLVCSLVAAILMICIGILSQQEARDAINWDIYVTIACAFGIGTALTNSGVAGGIANFLVSIGNAIGLGDAGVYGAVYCATFLISNVVTNNAAAALIFPIALDAAEQTGVDRKLMSYCIMLGASASFMVPFGYTTNLMVYGPGGYKYKDFLMIGTPLQLILWILSVAVLSLPSNVPWYLSWIVTSIVFVAVAAWRVYPDTVFGQNCRKG